MASPRPSIHMQEFRLGTSTSEETLLSKKEKRKTPIFEPQPFILASKHQHRSSRSQNTFDEYFVCALWVLSLYQVLM